MHPIPKKEDQNTEFKEAWNDDLLKWVCAFANAQGGELWIGVRDDGTPVGVRNAKKLLEDLPNKIVALLGIVAEVSLVEFGEADCIRIKVEPSNIPISLRGIYHVRSGATKQELTGPALQQFILRKMGRTWDDIPCHGATLADIDRKAISWFIQQARRVGRIPPGASSRDVVGTLQSLDLLADGGMPKIAAILLFGKRPGRFVPAVTFRIGRFGVDNTDLIIQDSVEGNIIQMPDRVVELLRTKYLFSPIHYEGMQRLEPLEIPEDALREAIYNSIVHKDYTGVHIQLRVYADRLELWNDGGLPDGWTPATLLGVHASKPRNKNIAATFYRAGFIEAWGRGIEKIRSGIVAAGLPAPRFEVVDGGLRMTIFRPAWVAKELGAGLMPGWAAAHPSAPAIHAADTKQDNCLPRPRDWPDSWPGPESGPELWSESWSESWPKSWSETFPSTVGHKIIVLLAVSPKGTNALKPLLRLSARSNSLRSAIASLLFSGLIERTIPDKPTSRFQKYRLTDKGRAALAASG